MHTHAHMCAHILIPKTSCWLHRKGASWNVVDARGLPRWQSKLAQRRIKRMPRGKTFINFSIAALTDYYKFGDLKPNKFIFLQFWRPETWKSRWWQGCVPSGDLSGEPTFLFYPAYKGHLHFLIHSPILQLQRTSVWFLLHLHIPFVRL